MQETPAARPSYDEAVALGRELNPGIRIGKPGRMTAWPFVAPLFQLLRLRVAITCEGAEHVAPGAAILVSNHQSTWDPVVTVMPTRWRVAAFTKAEWYEGPAALFFSVLGQIPLRRGDDAETDWALDMAHRALASGVKIGIYPEGTRGPDRDALYRLHQRVLVPLLRQNPDVPVHTVAVRVGSGGRRTQVAVRISPRLDLDPAGMTDDELTDAVRDSLVTHGGLRYVDSSAWRAKRAARGQGTDD